MWEEASQKPESEIFGYGPIKKKKRRKKKRKKK